MLIHAEEVSGKDCGFVAAGAAADFHHGVLAVVRVCGNEEELYLLLHFREFGLNLGNFVAGHFLEVLVFFIHEDVLGLRKFVHQPLVLKAGGNDGLKLLVVLVELDKFLHVGNNLRACQLLFQLLVFVLKAQDFFQQRVLCHSDCVLACKDNKNVRHGITRVWHFLFLPLWWRLTVWSIIVYEKVY